MQSNNYHRTSVAGVGGAAFFLPVRHSINVEVRFGTPSSDCRGLGICRVVPKARWQINDFGRSSCYRAMACLSRRGSRLELHFIRRTMCAYSLGKYFRDQQFIMEETITLPAAVRKELKLPDGVLEKGVYPVEEREELISVIFAE